MSVKGFNIEGTIEKYDYNALDNLPESVNIDNLKSAISDINSEVFTATSKSSGSWTIIKWFFLVEVILLCNTASAVVALPEKKSKM